jgi:antitoxin MazE
MSQLQKWGNSLAVRIPAAIADQLDLKPGTDVEVVATEGSILISPKPKSTYRLKDLLKDCKPSQLHGETDFGPDVGREVLDPW